MNLHPNYEVEYRIPDPETDEMREAVWPCRTLTCAQRLAEILNGRVCELESPGDVTTQCVRCGAPLPEYASPRWQVCLECHWEQIHRDGPWRPQPVDDLREHVPTNERD